jgi:hypothetical protein
MVKRHKIDNAASHEVRSLRGQPAGAVLLRYVPSPRVEVQRASRRRLLRRSSSPRALKIERLRNDALARALPEISETETNG